MQVRMMPVSFVFQRFPRLVRDISRKLGKEVNLVLEGEDTEADKNIIEALADPLMHIVRNSLDHGIESPEVRRAAGKPAAGTLTIRAAQESDRVADRDPRRRQGYRSRRHQAQGLRQGPDRRGAPGAHQRPGGRQSGVRRRLVDGRAVSDLSGRGVGMDVVRSAVEKVNGTVALTSERGPGHPSAAVAAACPWP